MGHFLVTRAAWPVMRAQGYGRVVMTSSSGGMFAMEGESNYAAAKGGVYGLMKALAFEGAEHGIRVNAILPMASTLIAVDRPVPDYERYYPSGIAAALKPRRTTDAVAPLVAYLASRDCAVSSEAFHAGFGRYARVFVGETHGWVRDDGGDEVTADDIAAHLDEIRDRTDYAVPSSIFDEVPLHRAGARHRGVRRRGVRRRGMSRRAAQAWLSAIPVPSRARPWLRPVPPSASRSSRFSASRV